MLTDLMGGEIRLDSTPGQGALFTVRLFLPALHGQQAEQALPRQQRTGYLGPRRRVLLVDNEAVDRAMLRHMLQALGFELAEASNGEDCLAQLPAFRPHAVFMDLAMPGMDGWQTLRAIRQAQAGMADAAALAIISANAFEKGRTTMSAFCRQIFRQTHPHRRHSGLAGKALAAGMADRQPAHARHRAARPACQRRQPYPAGCRLAAPAARGAGAGLPQG
jgi:CheY-like chemotaxis protein